MRTRTGLVVAAAALALAVTGCRGQDDEVTTDVGVTADACPNAVNPDNGCIFLGSISDLTVGPFAPLAVPITAAQKAFWKRVNDAGGIGGYDIDVTTYVRDNKYDPQVHNQVYQEIKGKVLALAQTLGSPTTAAILDDLKTNNIVSVPASWTSGWEFEDVIVESGANYCFESMNAVDYAVDTFQSKSVMAVHWPGDYGADAAAGVKVAAEARGLTFTDVETQPGPDNQAGAIQQIISAKPDLVIITTGPTDAATVIGNAAAQGYTGKFIGTSPTWNPALLESPAADAFRGLYLQSGPWQSFGASTPGHEAMRAAVGDVQPSDGYTAGWVWSYPLKAALEKAADDGDLTRTGLLNAVKSLTTVDYEGMLPPDAGNFAPGGASAYRASVISKVDDAAPTGVSVVKDLFVGPTAQAYDLSKPCWP